MGEGSVSPLPRCVPISSTLCGAFAVWCDEEGPLSPTAAGTSASAWLFATSTLWSLIYFNLVLKKASLQVVFQLP